MTAVASITDVSVADRTVLLRADLNVPFSGNRISDITRIERLIPSLEELIGRGARVVIASHFGRPNGEPSRAYSLEPVTDALSALLRRGVTFVRDCVGMIAESAVAKMAPGDVILLENLRFYHGEEANDASFARRLAVLADLYVNDAFSCAHRAHASTHAITRMLPSYGGAGLLAELDALSTILETPRRPVAALVGGAKISTKIALLENLANRMDVLIVGGGMANTFLAAKGHAVGSSLVEPGHFGIARRIFDNARSKGCEIVLPSDVVVAETFKAGAPHRTTAVTAVPREMMILDAGPQSIAEIVAKLSHAKTLLWNGPLGAFELEPFDRATVAVARAAADLTRKGELVSVAGGGDTVSALNAANVAGDFSYVSTAGGAFLEWLEGKDLPGIQALTEARVRQEENR